MKKFKRMKFKTNNLEHRNLVINMLKTLGYETYKNIVNLHLDDCLYVYANVDGGIRGGLPNFDKWNKHQEIDVSWMDPEQYKETPETITIMGKTFVKSEFENAINNLKEV